MATAWSPTSHGRNQTSNTALSSEAARWSNAASKLLSPTSERSRACSWSTFAREMAWLIRAAPESEVLSPKNLRRRSEPESH